MIQLYKWVEVRNILGIETKNKHKQMKNSSWSRKLIIICNHVSLLVYIIYFLFSIHWWQVWWQIKCKTNHKHNKWMANMSTSGQNIYTINFILDTTCLHWWIPYIYSVTSPNIMFVWGCIYLHFIWVQVK